MIGNLGSNILYSLVRGGNELRATSTRLIFHCSLDYSHTCNVHGWKVSPTFDVSITEFMLFSTTAPFNVLVILLVILNSIFRSYAFHARPVRAIYTCTHVLYVHIYRYDIGIQQVHRYKSSVR